MLFVFFVVGFSLHFSSIWEFEFKGTLQYTKRALLCEREFICLFLYYIVQRLCLFAAWLLEQLEKGKKRTTYRPAVNKFSGESATPRHFEFSSSALALITQEILHFTGGASQTNAMRTVRDRRVRSTKKCADSIAITW